MNQLMGMINVISMKNVTQREANTSRFRNSDLTLEYTG